MKEFTLDRSHMNVSIVGSVLLKQETDSFMKILTLSKSLMNVNNVVNVLSERETWGDIRTCTLKIGHVIDETVTKFCRHVFFVSVREQEVVQVQDLQTTLCLREKLQPVKTSSQISLRNTAVGFVKRSWVVRLFFGNIMKIIWDMQI